CARGVALLLIERGLPRERLQQQKQRRVVGTRKDAEEPRGLVRARERRERDVEQQRRVEVGELVEVELAHPREQAVALVVVDLGLRAENPRLGRELLGQRLAAIDEHLPVALPREEPGHAFGERPAALADEPEVRQRSARRLAEVEARAVAAKLALQPA